MRKLKLVESQRPPVLTRPAFVGRYYVGEVNRCPNCGGKAWHVGRIYAECASERCGYALGIGCDR